MNRALSLVAALALAACGDASSTGVGEESSLQLGQVAQPVVGGEPSDDSTNSVVLLNAHGPDGGRSCTGSVVAPRMIITARHCVSTFVDGSFSCTSDGNLGDSSDGAGSLGSPYSADLIEVRVGTSPFDDEPTAIGEKVYVVQTDTICRNDLALVRLDRELDVPLLPMRLTTQTLPQETITAIGYGQKDVSARGRYERHGVEILSVGPSSLYPEGRNAYPRTFSVGSAVCPGDSGGPALSESGAVLGVASLIIGNCLSTSVRSFYTQLAAYRSFIEQSFADSGFEPIYETPPVATSGGFAGAAGESSGGTGGTDSTTDTGSGTGGGSGGSGGSDPQGTGGTNPGANASGGATTSSSGSSVIGGRRQADGCSCSLVPTSGGPGAMGLLLLAIGAARRRPKSGQRRPHR